VSSATHQLFFESSCVSNRRDPHMCVAELTNQVACRPSVVRRKMPQSTQFHPPASSSPAPSTASGSQ
jgi:hypothetical protein